MKIGGPMAPFFIVYFCIFRPDYVVFLTCDNWRTVFAGFRGSYLSGPRRYDLHLTDKGVQG